MINKQARGRAGDLRGIRWHEADLADVEPLREQGGRLERAGAGPRLHEDALELALFIVVVAGLVVRLVVVVLVVEQAERRHCHFQNETTRFTGDAVECVISEAGTFLTRRAVRRRGGGWRRGGRRAVRRRRARAPLGRLVLRSARVRHVAAGVAAHHRARLHAVAAATRRALSTMSTMSFVFKRTLQNCPPRRLATSPS